MVQKKGHKSIPRNFPNSYPIWRYLRKDTGIYTCSPRLSFTPRVEKEVSLVLMRVSSSSWYRWRVTLPPRSWNNPYKCSELLRQICVLGDRIKNMDLSPLKSNISKAQKEITWVQMRGSSRSWYKKTTFKNAPNSNARKRCQMFE